MTDLVDEKKYPIFFNDFYIDGNVDKSKTSILLKEVCEIESILKSINKDESLISKQPDILKVENHWKFLDNSARNMADYFLTPNKESMFEVFKFNIEYAIKKDAPVFIKYYLM